MDSYWIYSQDLSGIMPVLVTACVFLYNRRNLNLVVSIQSQTSVCQVKEDSPLAFRDTEAYKVSGRATNPGN